MAQQRSKNQPQPLQKVTEPTRAGYVGAFDPRSGGDRSPSPLVPRQVMIGDEIVEIDPREVEDEYDGQDLSQIPMVQRLKMRLDARPNAHGLTRSAADDCYLMGGDNNGCCVKLGRIGCPFLEGHQSHCPFYESKADADSKRASLPIRQRLGYGMGKATKADIDAFDEALRSVYAPDEEE